MRRGLRRADVRPDGDVHADESGGSRKNRADQEADGLQGPEQQPGEDEDDDADDADGAVLPAEIRLCAFSNGGGDLLHARLDGVPYDISEARRIRTQSCFNIFARVPTGAAPHNAYPSASDGFWLMLRPLEPGKHTLKFGGRYNNRLSEYGRMIQDIEYELVVR